MQAQIFRKAFGTLCKAALLTCSIPVIAQTTSPSPSTINQAESEQGIGVVLNHFLVDPTNSVPNTSKPLPLDGNWSSSNATDSCPKTKYSCFHILYRVPSLAIICDWTVLLRETAPQGLILDMNKDAARYFTYKTLDDVSKHPMIERISTNAPFFSPIAKPEQADGNIKMLAHIDTSGHVTRVELISGPELLRDGATGAVKKWVYKPLIIDSVAVPIQLLVTLSFVSH
jgi:hypothetical protein